MLSDADFQQLREIIDVDDNLNNQCLNNKMACIDSSPNFLTNMTGLSIITKYNKLDEQVSVEEGLMSQGLKTGLWRYSQRGMSNVFWLADSLRHGK